MPRPTKLNPEAAERIIQAVSVGAALEVAASVGGVTDRTLRRWIARGERQKKGEYAAFAKAIREAQSKLVTRLLAVIDKVAYSGDWKAAAWKLAHVLPDQYSDKRIELTGKNGRPIEHKLDAAPHLPPSPAEQAEILKILKECGALEQVLGFDPAAVKETADGSETEAAPEPEQE